MSHFLRLSRGIMVSILFCLFYLFSFSQAPLGIPYQAVVRNSDGSVMSSNPVTLTFKIHSGSIDGAVVYQETQVTTTNAQGWVSCIVGEGTNAVGSFGSINWSNGAKFLQIFAGNVDMGTQQLLSVPYALHTEDVPIRISATGDTLVIGSTSVIVPGISASNSTPSNNGGMGSQVLPGVGVCSAEYISVSGCGGQSTLQYDGVVYDLVEFGGQCWFADNLSTDQYSNGDIITNATVNSTWSSSSTGLYSHFNNDVLNDGIYGKLYNAFVILDGRGVCPTGWHVPSDCEWMYLENQMGIPVGQLDMFGTRGTVEGGQLKSTALWSAPNTGATNAFGFNALPGGYRTDVGTFYLSGSYGDWWTTSAYTGQYIYFRELYNNTSTIGRDAQVKNYGFSVRCLKN